MNWLIPLDVGGKAPYLQIADMIEEAVASGALPTNARVPTVRSLARALKTAPATVLRGYQEAQRRKLLHAVVGRGTFVRPEPQGHPEARAQFARRGRAAPGTFDLRSTVVPGPESWVSGDGLRELLPRLSRQRAVLSSVFTTRDSLEPWQVRQAGVRWAAHCGLSIEPESMHVAAGGQHGIAAALAVLRAAGGPIAVPATVNSGIIAAAQALGLRLVAVRTRGGEPDPRHLAHICRAAKPVAFYCSPAAGNPIPVEMAAETRARIAQLSERYGFWIVEDDSAGPLVDRSFPSLASMVPARTIWIGSVAQSLGFGFRVAFVAVPTELRDAMQGALRALAWGGTTPSLLLAIETLKDGTAERVVAERRNAIAARQALCEQVLHNYRRVLRGVPYFWMETPANWTTENLHRALLLNGVYVASSKQFTVEPMRPARGLRISLGALLDLPTYRHALELISSTAAHPGRFRREPSGHSPRSALSGCGAPPGIASETG